MGQRSLADQRPLLYRITLTKNITLVSLKQKGQGVIKFRMIKFRRDLYGERLRIWKELGKIWNSLILNDQQVKIVWNLTKNGMFTAKSFYLALQSKGVKFPYRKLWKLKIPLKIKVFVLLLIKNKILTKDNLFKRGWRKGDRKCKFCDKHENILHLFFECQMSRLTWNIITVAFNLKPIRDMQHLFCAQLKNIDKNLNPLVIVGVAATLWGIWKMRNKACFKNKLPGDPNELTHYSCHWMSLWAQLQRLEEK